MTGPGSADTEPPDSEGEVTSAVRPVLEDADIAVFILGPEFTVRWINESAEEYFGIAREDVIGTDKRTLVESTIRSIFEQSERFAETVLDTYRNNTYVEEFECHVLPGNGREERWLLHQSRPIERGELAGGRLEHYTDITERKASERDLERQNKRLSEFASIVSHDLRGPLAVAQGRLELAREECDTAHHDGIATALDRMERIVEDVLWLAREGKDVGSLESVSLRDATESAWLMATEGAGGAELRYAGGESRVPTIAADSDRLDQLLENLFRNAVEHGGEDVTVTVGGLPEGFYVEDDGPGIPETNRDDVFEAGYSTTEDGTGFGLSIVRRVTGAHGWDIRVTGGADGGARFEVTGVESAD